jgi:hypothetical protein
MSDYTQLWAAVLHRAIQDALWRSPAELRASGAKRYRHGDWASRPSGYDISSARRWLTSEGQDLKTVVAFAGIDYEALQKQIEIWRAAGWQETRPITLTRSPLK